MEKFNELDLVYLKNQDYNIYHNAHIVFYTKNADKIDLLLVSNNENKEFSHITTQILPQDNSPIFSIARILTNEVTIFNDDNFSKILNGETLTNEDLEKSKTSYHHELWEQKDYLYWLDKLSDDTPIVQFDLIKSHMFYFWEIPKIDLNKLNENLKNINCSYSFAYFPCDSLNNDSTKNLNQTALKFYNAINVQTHINDSLKRIKSNDLDMYYVLSIKPSDGTKLDQAGFFHFPALFKGLYRKNTENWTYLVCSHKLPDEKDLENAKAIIVPGSHISINDDFDFLRNTEKWIKNFHMNHPKVKYLGICFGMQIFNTALGGKVEKLKSVPFDMGPRKIEISEEFWNLDFVKKSNLDKSNSLSMMKVHGDECTIIPQEGKLTNFGKSLNCYNEIMVCEDERIFLVQGHPEYLPIFNIERMSPIILMREKKEKTTENILAQREKFISDMAGDIHSNEYRKLCYSFLKN